MESMAVGIGTAGVTRLLLGPVGTDFAFALAGGPAAGDFDNEFAVALTSAAVGFESIGGVGAAALDAVG